MQVSLANVFRLSSRVIGAGRRGPCTSAQWLLSAIVVFNLWGLAPSPADSPNSSTKQPTRSAKKEQPLKPSQSNARREDWFSRWVRGQQFYKYRKNAPEVRKAFDEVATEAAQATVQILCDQHPKILGLVVDSDGYIVTKASELKGTIEVQLSDRDVVPAELISIDRRNDLALLKIEGRQLVAAKWATETKPQVGSWVVAPAPGRGTLAIGIVSTTDRWVRGGVLGVFLEPTTDGPRIVALNPQGGGGKAGLRRGDVVVAVNGKPVKDVDAAIHAIGSYLPGETVHITVRRGDEEVELEAKLDSIHESFNNKRAQFQNSLGTALSERRAGFPAAFEHDLGLPPAQCGGPLVNLKGRVVGINIARAGRVSSFAIPTSVVTKTIAEMKAGQHAARRAVAQQPATEELETVEAGSQVGNTSDGSH